MAAVCVKQPLQLRGELGAKLVRNKVKMQRDDVRGLRFDRQRAVGIHKMLIEGLAQFLGKAAVVRRVLGPVDDRSHFCKQPGGVAIERGAGVGRGRRAEVAELQLVGEQAALAAVRRHKIYPALHRLVLPADDAGVAVGEVEVPREDDVDVCPCGCAAASLLGQPVLVALAGDDVRHDMRDRAVLGLVEFDVAEPLGIERIRVHQEHGRAAKNLHVARPAQTLVALRAVGGAGLAHGRVQHERGEVLGADLAGPFQYLRVSKAVVGEARLVFCVPAAAGVIHGLLRGAEICGVDVAVCV